MALDTNTEIGQFKISDSQESKKAPVNDIEFHVDEGEFVDRIEQAFPLEDVDFISFRALRKDILSKAEVTNPLSRVDLVELQSTDDETGAGTYAFYRLGPKRVSGHKVHVSKDGHNAWATESEETSAPRAKFGSHTERPAYARVVTPVDHGTYPKITRKSSETAPLNGFIQTCYEAARDFDNRNKQLEKHKKLLGESGVRRHVKRVVSSLLRSDHS